MHDLLSGGVNSANRHNKRIANNICMANPVVCRSFDDFFGHFETYGRVLRNTSFIIGYSNDSSSMFSDQW